MSFATDLIQRAESSFNRFPITLTWVTIGSFFLILLFGTDDYQLINQFSKLNLVFILGVSWFIASQFVAESLKYNTFKRFGLKFLVFIGLLIYLESNKIELNEADYVRWYLLMIAGHLFIFFAPFITSWNKYKFWNYLKIILTAILRSSLYSILLFVGLTFAVASLDFLFDIELNSNIYFQVFIFCIGIVNTFIYLSDFPEIKGLKEKIIFSRPNEVLILYILIPLALLYISIVYIYAITILIKWELPQGWVTYLISALSFLGFTIHIAIEPIRKTNKAKLIRNFFPYYFYAIIPLLPLLFTALYRRIADYNFTEWRYLGLVFAIWISIMIFYMNISKIKATTIYVKSIFLFVLLSTFGPWSAFSVSVDAQLDELRRIVQKSRENTNKKITEKKYERFESIVRYLAERNALHQTKPLIGFNVENAFTTTSKYGLSKKIIDSLNIEVEKATLNSNMRIFNSRHMNRIFNFDISKYRHFVELNLRLNANYKDEALLTYDKNGIIKFMVKDKLLMENDISNHLSMMAEKYKNMNNASRQDFTLEIKNDKGKFLLVFDYIKYKYDKKQVEIIVGSAKMFYSTTTNYYE